MISFPLAQVLLLIGPLVAVPLGLALVARGSALSKRWTFARCVQIPAAILLIPSMLVDTGWVAAALALPWFLFSLVLALLALLRLVERGCVWPMSECSIDCGLLYLSIGAVWLLASRLGIPFLGFEEPFVFLTAAHFHFAGFVLPIVCGLAARHAKGSAAGWTAAGAVAGVPLVAVGIQLSLQGIACVELGAAIFLSLVSFFLAAQMMILARHVESRALRLLPIVAAASLAIGMCFSTAYAISQYFELAWLSIPEMIWLHAPLNVFGFSLPALVFFSEWDVARTSTGTRAGSGLRLTSRWIDEKPDPKDWREVEFGAKASAPLDSDRRVEDMLLIGVEGPGAPEPDGPFVRAARAIANYEIFAPTTLRRLGENGALKSGDAVITGFGLPLGLELVFGSRVTELHDGLHEGRHRQGFTYRTLGGHPFAGEESFLVEKDVVSGDVRVLIRSWSRPRFLMVRVLGAWVRRCQSRAVREALERLRRSAEKGSMSRCSASRRDPFSPNARERSTKTP